MARFIGMFLLILLAATVGNGSAMAQLDQTPGPAFPNSKEDVQIYRPDDGKLVGRVSIPDEKLSVLMQPQGREWREFRTVWLRWITAVAILGMVALLMLFYLIRGRVRVESGFSGHTVPRFNSFERFAHWTTAVSFLTLALTGLILTFGRPLLIPLVGHEGFTTISQTGKSLHNFFGLPFIVGVVLMFVMWARDNIPNRSDTEWLRKRGGLFGDHVAAERFNAGQKAVFWAVVIGGITLTGSGLMLMMPFTFVGIGMMQLVQIIHAVLAALMMAVILAHIYIGTLGMEGAFDAMGNGQVDSNWAKEHHAAWYQRKITGRRKGEPPAPVSASHPAE